jgi:hypothetical protein
LCARLGAKAAADQVAFCGLRFFASNREPRTEKKESSRAREKKLQNRFGSRRREQTRHKNEICGKK